jgi:hypothetical protein
MVPSDLIPFEVIYEIFALLPLGDVISCRNVCKKWRIITQDLRLWCKIRLTELYPHQLKVLPRIGYFRRQLLYVREFDAQPSLIVWKIHHLVDIIDLIKSAPLVSFHLELPYWHIPADIATRMLISLPSSIIDLSLQGPFVVADSLIDLLAANGSKLQRLTLSCTCLGDDVLVSIAQYCTSLKHLSLTKLYCITSSGMRDFLIFAMSPRLSSLKIDFFSVDPAWIDHYIMRQRAIGARQLEFLSIEGCDLFTLTDIMQLRRITNGKCSIIHSAVLEDNTLDAYRRFVDMMTRCSP